MMDTVVTQELRDGPVHVLLPIVRSQPPQLDARSSLHVSEILEESPEDLLLRFCFHKRHGRHSREVIDKDHEESVPPDARLTHWSTHIAVYQLHPRARHRLWSRKLSPPLSHSHAWPADLSGVGDPTRHTAYESAC